MISADTLRLHLAYSAWANQRLLAAAVELSPEELTRDFKTADKSVLGTLFHGFWAERLWLGRIQGETPGPLTDQECQLAVLETAWPELMMRWREWAESLTDESSLDLIAYNMREKAWETPLWQILLHVVNHGTHHRGQAVGFLRSMGHTPPRLDLLAFYLSR